MRIELKDSKRTDLRVSSSDFRKLKNVHRSKALSLGGRNSWRIGLSCGIQVQTNDNTIRNRGELLQGSLKSGGCFSETKGSKRDDFNPFFFNIRPEFRRIAV